MLIKLKSKDSKGDSCHLMKISIFNKSYITKACSFVIATTLIAGIPSLANASFFSDLFGGAQVQADESTTSISSGNGSVLNSQTIPLLESSVNPDLIKTKDPKAVILVQNDSFISTEDTSEDTYIPDVSFEKSTLSDQIRVYTVQKGDTLSEIADTFDVSTNTIRWENNIVGEKISVGQKLNILPMTGVKHIVKSGDTIKKIADKYEADAEDITVFNDISDGETLKKGDIVFVPNGIIKPVIPKVVTPSKVFVSNTKAPSGYYLRPVPGPVTSPYGSRHGSFHPGVDLGGPVGTPVMVAADGVVTEVITGCAVGRKKCGGGYGNHIEVQHANGTTTRYAHLSRTSVSLGQTVSQGQTIGALGNTGSSTGPHLHFEIINVNGSKMRPVF